MVTLLLGGKVGGRRLSGWDLSSFGEDVRPPQGGAATPCPDEDEDELTDILDIAWVRKVGCLRVASFLAWMMGTRSSVIREKGLAPDPTSTEGRSPNG